MKPHTIAAANRTSLSMNGDLAGGGGEADENHIK